MSLTEQAREAKNAWMRKYRREHPERVAAANQRYWEKIAAQMEEAGELPKGGGNNGNKRKAPGRKTHEAREQN